MFQYTGCKFYRKTCRGSVYGCHSEDCDIHFSYARGHSGNLGNDRADQLAKAATSQYMNLSGVSVSLFHCKHLAWEKIISTWNTKFLASPKALWTKIVFSNHLPTVKE
ncbi:hypothetical protein TNCV_3535081 [Trichonephila clavipes]|nr:hypothetical protein TNCV_3535081 [Trichonephila clavipes]